MSDSKICPACSATLPAAAAFCTTCGQAQAGLGPNPAPGHLGQGAPLTSPLAPRWQIPDAPPPVGSWSGQDPTDAWAPGASHPLPPVSAPAPADDGHGSLIGGILALLGGIFVLIGLFTPWIGGNVGGDTLTGWGLTPGDNGLSLPNDQILLFSSKDPFALLLLGIAGMLIGVLLISGRSRALIRTAGAAVGAAILILLAVDWITMSRLVSDKAPSTFQLAAQPGFYLAIGGGLLIGISSILSFRKAPV